MTKCCSYTYKFLLHLSQTYDAASIQQAVSDTDLVIVCLGTGQDVEAEGHDRASLDLPGWQLDLLKDAVYYGKLSL